MNEQINCPFCDKVVVSDIDACEHLFSILDVGYVEWNDELAVLDSVSPG